MGMSSKEVHDDGRQNKLLQATTLLGFQKPRKEEEEVQNSMEKLDCPRCGSQNTKFCYYNNYNKSQPRHFCKSCKRHWTKGGTLRNVPVGGGRNKNKRIKIASKPQGKTGKTLNPQKSNNFSSKSDRPIGCSNIISLFPDPVSAAESTLPGNDHQDLKFPFQFSDLFSLDANPCSFQTSAVGCSFNGEITEDTNADIGTYSWDWHDINGLVSGEFSFSFPDSENNR